jgi:radical SAM enzyme (TIGR01210 family)
VVTRKPDPSLAILRASEIGGKTYSFDEEHDPGLPAQMWFQESDEGLVLFVVFYTQACQWSRCLGCNLPSKSSQYHVDYRSLISQIDHVFKDPKVRRQSDQISKLIISNNGSILDEDTFSSTALIYLIAQANLNLAHLSVLSLETRPEYVDLEELEFLSRALKEGDTPTALELAVGFEAFDDRIRNEVFKKGLHLHLFEELVENVAAYGFRLKCYFMQKPVPRISDEEAVQDIMAGVDYLSELASRYGLRINMHLNPTYVAYGTLLEKSFRQGEYRPPRLLDVARAAMHAEEKPLSIFVGLFDEGLAVPGGSFIREGEEPIVGRLQAFNRTQDFNIIRPLFG